MGLTLIIYQALLYVFAFFILLLTVSYISHKMKKKNQVLPDKKSVQPSKRVHKIRYSGMIDNSSREKRVTTNAGMVEYERQKSSKLYERINLKPDNNYSSNLFNLQSRIPLNNEQVYYRYGDKSTVYIK